MKSQRSAILAAGTLIALFAAPCVGTEAQPRTVAPEGSIPIAQLIGEVARRTGKTFLLDPRVQADVVLLGADQSKLDYAELLSVLQVYGYATVEEKNHVRVVPDAVARQLPLPLISGTETRPNAEYVGKVLTVKSLPAAQLVPILRPLLPQQAHLVAIACTNVLVIVDTFANVQRIEKLVRALDTAGEPYKSDKCGVEPVAQSLRP
jgi:general secretion pathway protein D